MTNAVLGPARRVRLVAVLCAPLLLAACTPSDGVKELEALFDEDQQVDDVLPDAVLDDVAVDGESTRHLGVADDVTYYAARSDDGASTCLVLVDDRAAEGVSGCTIAPNPTGTEVSNGKDTVMFVMPGTDFTSLEQSGWTRHGDFLAVR